MPHLLQLLLLLVIIVFTAKAAGALSVRFGQPAVFGEILVGLLLGPTAIALLRLWPFASTRETAYGASCLLAPVAVSQGASKRLAPHPYEAELLPERLYGANEQKKCGESCDPPRQGVHQLSTSYGSNS